MEKTKRQKGITLVALVITIVILLILVGFAPILIAEAISFIRGVPSSSFLTEKKLIAAKISAPSAAPSAARRISGDINSAPLLLM